MKITIFGLAGTGTSTLGRALAKELNYQFYSTGNIMREEAKKRNLSIYEFDELVKKDSQIDLDLDNKVKKIGKDEDNFIFESRFAWYFIPHSIKIHLDCNEKIRFERISEREKITIDEAKLKTLRRAKVLENRFSDLYEKNIYPPKKEKFDLVLDSTNTVVEDLIKEIKEYLNKLSS